MVLHALDESQSLEIGNRSDPSPKTTTHTTHSNLRKFFGRSKGEDGGHQRTRKNTIPNFFASRDVSGGTSSDEFSLSSSIVTEQDISPTQEQIDLVRISWERVSELRHPNDDINISPSHAFGLAFYDALFESNNELRPLFTNIFQQARALTGMISYIARAPAVTNRQDNGQTGEKQGSSYPPSDSSSDCSTGGNRVCPFTGIERPMSPVKQRPIYTIREINARKRAREGSLSDDEAMPDYDEGDPEWLVYKLNELGARHCYYNVLPEHLRLVGPAFVCALKVRLGEEYEPRIGEAWLKAHAFAAYHMTVGLESQLAWEKGERYRSSRRNKAACSIQ